MSRITKVQGEFMGVRFEVKPTPIRFDKIVEERRQMLLGWYKEKHPKTYKKIQTDVSFDDYSPEDFEAVNGWRLDEEFRAKYCEFTANHCMKLEKPIDKKTWKSDELELGTLEEAWDFFTNRRQVPSNGVGVL